MTVSTRFVEFAGLPGAGKTTIARDLVIELTNMGYSCFCNASVLDSEVTSQQPAWLASKLQTLSRLLVSCVRRPKVALSAFGYAVRVRPCTLASFARAAQLLIRLEFIKTVLNAGYDTVVFDQGMVQYIWSISVTGALPPNKYLVRLLDHILEEIAPAIIYVDVDADAATDRISKRATSSSRFDRMPSTQAKRVLARQSAFFDAVVNWNDDHPEYHHLVVDGRQPVATNLPEIEVFMQAILRKEKEAQV